MGNNNNKNNNDNNNNVFISEDYILSTRKFLPNLWPS